MQRPLIVGLLALAGCAVAPAPNTGVDDATPATAPGTSATVLACELPAVVPQRPARVPLTPCVNSRADEYLPRLSLDGQVLYVVRRAGSADDAAIADEDIWHAPRSSVGWLAARRAPTPLNNSGNNFVVAARGDSVLLGNVYRDDGGMERGLSTSVRGGSGWSPPVPVPIEVGERSGRWSSYALSADGAVLLSHAERAGGAGGTDLYIRFRDGAGWSEAVNLRALNTPGDEITPYLSEDNSAIYFSSDGRGGRDQDVYVARRLDDGWSAWTEPLPLRSPVNGAGFDAFFVPANERDEAYMASMTGDRGLDVFRIARLVDVVPPDVARLTGSVADARTGRPLEATVVLLSGDASDAAPRTLTAAGGAFSVDLPLEGVYLARATAPGYLTEEDTIRIASRRPMHREFALRQVVEGLTLRLDVHFDTNRSEIRPESHPELDRAARMLVEHPTLRLEVGGHTDAVGSDRLNERLSQARASAVLDYLVEAGVEADRISARGYGENRPVASNDTDEGRARNRRVEVRLDRAP